MKTLFMGVRTNELNVCFNEAAVMLYLLACPYIKITDKHK